MAHSNQNKGVSGIGGGGSTVFNDIVIGTQNPLTDYTIIRGKTVLVSPTEEQFDLLKKRLQERTEDCRGETIYEVGIGEGKLGVLVGTLLL